MHHCYLGSVPLGPNFTGTRSSTAEMLIPSDRQLIVLTEALEVVRQCSRLLMVFSQNVCKKTTNLGIWTPFWESQSWCTTLVHGSLETGKPVLIELFSLSITVLELRGEMCTAQLFSQGSISLHSNFSWTRSSPSTILGTKKLEALGYLMVKIASLCVPLFWHNTGVWWTDRRTEHRRTCQL